MDYEKVKPGKVVLFQGNLESKIQQIINPLYLRKMTMAPIAVSSKIICR